MSRKSTWKLLKRMLASILGAYALIIVVFFVMQERILFHPAGDGHGLAYYQEHGKLKGVKELYIDSYGGVRLQAWYRKPDPGYDMVLFFHGNAGNIEQRAGKVQLLADMGYGFLIPAWRGFGGSTGTPSKEGIYEDARAAVRFLLKQGYDSKKVVIIGESLGSGAAVKMAAEKEFKGLLLITPYTSIADRGNELYPFLPVQALLKHNFDNLSNIKDVHVPIIVVHGTKDTVMPHWHSEKLVDEANEPKKLIIYPGIGHNDYDVVEVFEHMRNFLNMANNHKSLTYDTTMERTMVVVKNTKVQAHEANPQPKAAATTQ